MTVQRRLTQNRSIGNLQLIKRLYLSLVIVAYKLLYYAPITKCRSSPRFVIEV